MIRFGAGVALALALLLGASCTSTAPPIPAADLLQIPELARVLADSTAVHPVLLHTGFAPLYRAGHIPGSRFVGASSKPEGIATLVATLKTLPPDQEVVLYCGCCPWVDCPNMRPAYRAAKQTGRRIVRVLEITGSLERDWIDKGLPVAEGE